MKDVESIINKINNVSFYNCEGVRCGDSLYYLLALRNDEGSIVLFLKAVKKLILFIIAEDYKIERCGTGGTLFLYSGSGGRREDLYRNFSKVVSVSKNHVLMEPNNVKRVNLRRLKYIKEVLIWIKNLQKSGLSFSLKVFVIAYLLDAYAAYEIVKKSIGIDTINSLVVLCDVQIIDSFFVQKFNLLGKTTITLQHGNVSSLTNTWALSGSKSKYFLACNQFSINESKCIGYNNIMKLVGFYAYVNNEIQQKGFISEVKTIGAFADGTNDEDNYRMLDTLLRYCDTSGCILKVKLHPTNQKEKYVCKYSDKRIIIVDKAMSVFDFCNMIDIAIIRNSATLTEVLQYGVPSYIINDSLQVMDIYKNVDILKFRTAEELYDLINQRTMSDIQNDLEQGQALFCCEGDITYNYIKAFNSLGIS